MNRQKLLWYGAAGLAGTGACCFAVSGMRFSGVLCWLSVFFLLLLAVLDRLSGEHRWARHGFRALLSLLAALAAVFLLFEAQVVSGSVPDDDSKEVSCVLVLGAGVNGTEPSLLLAKRMDAALAFISDKPEIPVIVSGCQGRGEDISEAECMARYLIAHGIPSERIWKEEQAGSTRTNFQYALSMMRMRGTDSAKPFACVTSDFHVARSRYVAGRMGVSREGLVCIGASLPSGAYYSALTMNYYIREAFALANEMLMGVDLDL